MMERGYIERMKSIPWKPTPQELGILEMIFEFAGRVIPENDGVPESKKQFNVSIDSLVERLERGEPLTRLDVIRSYFTRVGLQNERLARAVGDFDLEKFGKYELGLIDKKEVANERFFLFLVGELKDYISDFKYINGDLEVVYKSGFRWKASDFAQGVKGFIEACDRMGCNTMMTDGRIYVYLPTGWS